MRPEFRAKIMLALAVTVASGCDAFDVAPEPAGTERYDRAFSRPYAPERVTAPFIAEAERAKNQDYSQILGSPALLLDMDTAALNRIEDASFESGQLLKFADALLSAVNSPNGQRLRPYLAWTYHRLGLATAAQAQLELCRKEIPDDALTLFVSAFLDAQSSNNDLAQLATVVARYRRVLEISPEFLGPAGISATDLRSEIAAIEQFLSRAPGSPQ